MAWLIVEELQHTKIIASIFERLYPRIAGGILARETKGDLLEMEKYGIQFIGLVVVNLYQFVAAIERPGITLEEAVEEIDVGGVLLIREAAKNYNRVTVVTHPSDYEVVLREMAENDGDTTLATRKRLAREAFQLTARYDLAVYNYLEQQGF